MEPAAGVSRSHEIQGTTKNRELTFEKGSLVLKSGDDKLCSPTDSEIKVHYATVRRALSFLFARLMSYAQHCQWESFLFDAMHRDAPPRLSQAFFAASAANVTRQLGGADGTYPLGEALLQLRHDPNVTLYFVPVAKPASAPVSGHGGDHRSQPHDVKGGNPKGNQKGKKKNPPVPAELRGKWYKTAKGWAFVLWFKLCKWLP